MDERVFKFPLEFRARQSIVMPFGARILTVQAQRGEICLWAIVDPAAPRVPRVFRVIGTGSDAPPKNGTYIGTAQFGDGTYVWHVFEELAA